MSDLSSPDDRPPISDVPLMLVGPMDDVTRDAAAQYAVDRAAHLAEMLERADNLADACSDLVTTFRVHPALAVVTDRLVDAHGLLVTAANTLARVR